MINFHANPGNLEFPEDAPRTFFVQVGNFFPPERANRKKRFELIFSAFFLKYFISNSDSMSGGNEAWSSQAIKCRVYCARILVS